MTWLLWLYPPAFRRRYGRELALLLAANPKSIHTVVDVIGGAVDAWLNPQSSTAVAADAKGAGAMLPRMLQLRTSGCSPEVTKADALKAAAVMILGTLAIVGVLSAAIRVYGNNAYIESLMAMGWLIPFVLSQHYTYLKGHSARAQAVLMGVPTVILIAIALANA